VTATGRERLGVVFGGLSSEHEVSVTSARSIMREADSDRFEVIPFGITRGGQWLTPDESRRRLERAAAEDVRDIGDDAGTGVLDYPEVLAELGALDVAFPIVHGPYGEDGTLQGMFELADVAYVGAGVAASAVGMDKELMRSVFAAHEIPQAPYLVVREVDGEPPSNEVLREVERVVGYPCFIKPCNGGSSVGVSKARSSEDVHEAVAVALTHDRKVLVEQALEGQEVECAVLGNDAPEASPVGEIRPSTEFYDYQSKYLDDSAELIVPAELDEAAAERVRELALRAFLAIDAAGLSRVDFFVTPEGDVRCLEINTLPGFTPISMYPRLWQETGVSYSDLISRLVDLGLERAEGRRRRAHTLS
jgi:D-alanine-D-alanine ligase